MLVGCFEFVNTKRVEVESVGGLLRVDAHHLQELAHRRNVAQLGDVREAVFSAREQRGRHERNRGVLRAADSDFAFQLRSALNQEFIHLALVKLLAKITQMVHKCNGLADCTQTISTCDRTGTVRREDGSGVDRIKRSEVC